MFADGFLDDPDSVWNRNHKLAQHLNALLGRQCLVLSGEPGLGKSVALEQAFPGLDHAAGGDANTIWIRFRDIPDASVFARRVFDSDRWKAWRSGDNVITLVLDGLDEGLIKIKDFLSFLTSELRSNPLERLKLVIACRTADWPIAAGNKLLSLWDCNATDSFWELCPLRKEDVEIAASCKQVSAINFLEQVFDKSVVTLAARPTTLFFLLRQFSSNGQLEGTHRDIYERGIRDLCGEPDPERAERSHATSPAGSVFTSDQLRDGAAYLAAMLIFSGRSAISVGDHDHARIHGDLHLQSLFEKWEIPRTNDPDVLYASLNTALFSSRGEQRLGFTHQSFAECLAARQVRELPLIQLRQLFCRVDGKVEHVIPQLAETAAWLAGANDDFLQHVLRVDPEVLLRSDIARIQGSRKRDVVQAILEKAKLLELFDEIGLRRFFSGLKHDGLAQQLWPYIDDDSLNVIVRRIALEIAEDCGLSELNDDLLKMLRDPAVEQQVRNGAARILKRTLPDSELSKLEPLVRGECGPDPDDELKAHALERLVPIHWSVAHASQWMQPPKNDHYHGAYWIFLHYHAPDRITVQDIPALLEFLHAIQDCFDTLSPFCRLAHRTLCLALSHLQIAEIRNAAVRLWREKRRAFAHSRGGEEAKSLGQLWLTDSIRRQFAMAILQDSETTDKDITKLLFDVFPLFEPHDLEWVLQQIHLVSLERLPLWNHVVCILARPENVAKCWDHFLQVIHAVPTLQVQFSWLRAWSLDEPEARKAKAQHLWDERRRRRFEKMRKSFPVSDLISEELARIARGDYWAWINLCWHLSLADGQNYYPAISHHDVTERYGWQISDESRRALIRSAAREFLLRYSDGYDELRSRTNFFDPGYVAIYLLRNDLEHDNELLAAIGTKWIHAVVGRFNNGEEYHQDLVALVYRLNPDTAVDALLREVQENYRQHGHIFAWRAFARCWDKRLSAILGAFTLSNSINEATLISSLCFLFEHDARAFSRWMSCILPRLGRVTEQTRLVVLAIAFALSPAEMWDLAWPQITSTAELAKKVLLSVASNLEFETRKHPPQLSAEKFGILGELLYSLFPPNAEVERLDGAVTPRQALADYRRKVMDALAASSERAAGDVLLHLATKFPIWEVEFMWRYRDHLNTRRRTLWEPPPPNELNKILSRPETRFLSTDADLFAVALESLERFETYYTRQELPAVERLWRWSKAGNRRTNFEPKDEEDFSDELARWLRDDLQLRGIIVGREVQIERRQKTDVLIKAISANADSRADPLTIVVEVKGCWNPGVRDDIEGQLVQKYLLPHSLKRGIYVAGWFVCDDWKSPRNSLNSSTLEDARTELRELGEDTTKRHPDLTIAGLLLDCRHR